MAANPMMSMAAARAALDAALALLNSGGTGYIKIFTGSMPASCGAADTGTLLAQLTLSADAFPDSADGGSNGLATATANAITSDTSADNTGTAGYFRAYNGSNQCVIQGTCGTSSADLILNTTSIVAGAIVAVTSWVVTLPDGSGVD